MTTPSAWTYWISLAAGSGLTAGIANQLISWLRERSQHTFQRDQYTREVQHQQIMLLDQRRHDARVRAEQAHYDARPVLLPYARNVHAWLYREWTVQYGQEYAYTSKVSSEVLLHGPADVLTNLGELAVAHPTRRVRDLARMLDTEIDKRYNVTPVGAEPRPSRKELERWISVASRLIEEIHEFPADPPIVEAAAPNTAYIDS